MAVSNSPRKNIKSHSDSSQDLLRIYEFGLVHLRVTETRDFLHNICEVRQAEGAVPTSVPDFFPSGAITQRLRTDCGLVICVECGIWVVPVAMAAPLREPLEGIIVDLRVQA